MFSTRQIATFSGLLVAGLMASVASADSVIVRSTGPSAKLYPPGKSVSTTTKLALKDGDVITLLSSTGTNIVKGPGLFSAIGSTTLAGSAFARLVSTTGARQTRTGATRGTGSTGTPHSPNLWYVDVTKSGSDCLTDPATAMLWRPAADTAGTLVIARVGDGKSVTIAFHEGQSVRSWPVAALPLTAGGQYRLSGSGLTKPTTIKVVMMPADHALDQLASALIKNGCDAQVADLADAAETAAK